MRMSVVMGCVVVGLSAGCMSPVMQFGAGKSARQAQHETMSDLTPKGLDTRVQWTGEIATRKIRVWADDQSFEEPLELANLVLTRVFGLRLVPELRAWERHVPGSTIADDLAALAERDPGDDVLLVVGLTSSLPLVSATFDQLGYAAVGGQHLIVRGYADLEERKLYAEAFQDLRPEERELSLDARRHHKTAVVLLHEIGHTLGFEHDAEQDTIMYASYSHRAGSFSAQARETMLRTLDRRLGRDASTGETRETVAAIEPRPRASSPAGPLVVHVTPSGALESGDKVIDQVDLDKLLEEARAQGRNTEVIIKLSRKAPANALEPIIDRVTALGLRASITKY